MNLESFETEIDALIVQRGRGYYNNNDVRKVSQIRPGYFKATVRGTEKYKTTIVLDENYTIIHSECTCPYWDFCKHRVALLYKIRKDGLHFQEDSEMDDVEQILENMSEQELKDYISKLATEMDGLRSRILKYKKGKKK